MMEPNCYSLRLGWVTVSLISTIPGIRHARLSPAHNLASCNIRPHRLMHYRPQWPLQRHRGASVMAVQGRWQTGRCGRDRQARVGGH